MAVIEHSGRSPAMDMQPKKTKKFFGIETRFLHRLYYKIKEKTQRASVPRERRPTCLWEESPITSDAARGTGKASPVRWTELQRRVGEGSRRRGRRRYTRPMRTGTGGHGFASVT